MSSNKTNGKPVWTYTNKMDGINQEYGPVKGEILAVIRRMKNRWGGVCKMSHENIGIKAGVCRETVTRGINGALLPDEAITKVAYENLPTGGLLWHYTVNEHKISALHLIDKASTNADKATELLASLKPDVRKEVVKEMNFYMGTGRNKKVKESLAVRDFVQRAGLDDDTSIPSASD